MNKSTFSIKKRIKSISFALNGITVFFKNEHNSHIHLIATICVIFLGIYLELNTIEWVVITLAIGLVFISEIINSSIERLADLVNKEISPEIKIIKDLAAAAVLFSAIISVIIGILVFGGKIFF
jgi:diacylglycerol kinase (ATP)